MNPEWESIWDGYPKEELGPDVGEGYCERPAGWGMSHAGSGRCKLHGGAQEGGGIPPAR